MDANTLPKGHIIGWAPPPKPSVVTEKPLSKSAKKNAKRREKKAEKKEVPEDWEEEEEESRSIPSTAKRAQANGDVPSAKETVGADRTQDNPKWAVAECDSTPMKSTDDTLVSEVEKMTL
jgi:partner of Y14 and mago